MLSFLYIEVLYIFVQYLEYRKINFQHGITAKQKKIKTLIFFPNPSCQLPAVSVTTVVTVIVHLRVRRRRHRPPST